MKSGSIRMVGLGGTVSTPGHAATPADRTIVQPPDYERASERSVARRAPLRLGASFRSEEVDALDAILLRRNADARQIARSPIGRKLAHRVTVMQRALGVQRERREAVST